MAIDHSGFQAGCSVRKPWRSHVVEGVSEPGRFNMPPDPV